MAELLIVDDEIHVVERLAALIPWHELGINAVHKAYSAYEALQLLEETSVNVIITDIQMPGMTGLELAEQVKANWRTTGCILLSGHAEFAYAQEAIQQGIADYMLKPVTDDDLMAAVQKVLSEQKRQWEQVISQQKIAHALKEHLPLLRSSLLNELLQGRRFSPEALRERMDLLQLPALHGEQCALLLVRMEARFLDYNSYSLSLLEYAIGNIFEELSSGAFELWHGRDSHDYLIFVAKPAAPMGEEERRHSLERAAAQLQSAVRTYLNGSISVVLSPWGRFPGELTALYRTSLAAFRRRIGSERELFMTVTEDQSPGEIEPLRSLYEPPALLQLLEAGQWDGAENKLRRIFDELDEIGPESEEHLLEVFFAVSSAFTSIAHKSGRRLSGLAGAGYEKLRGGAGAAFRTAAQLKEWSFQLLQTLQEDTEGEAKDTRASLVEQVNRFIAQHLAEDVSLQAIADHVFLHPVYVSKIYKLETGRNVSDYVYELRMDNAARFLLESQDKIYEIAARLGYQRAHSFINVFKKRYGLTPQEYRDKHLGQGGS